MSQARRTRKKTTSRRARKKSSTQWGLLLVVLLSGIVLGTLFKGVGEGDGEMGTGLKNLIEATRKANAEQRKQSEPVVQEQVKKPKDFDFYEVLPDINRVMPEDLPEETTSESEKKHIYYLQAASFTKQVDAEEMRAKLGLHGYQSETQAKQVVGKGTVYRVRLGPYDSKRKAKNIVFELKEFGINAFSYAALKL